MQHTATVPIYRLINRGKETILQHYYCTTDITRTHIHIIYIAFDYKFDKRIEYVVAVTTGHPRHVFASMLFGKFSNIFK